MIFIPEQLSVERARRGKVNESAKIVELPKGKVGPLAQLVEQRTFNPWVVGSSPTGPTHPVISKATLRLSNSDSMENIMETETTAQLESVFEDERVRVSRWTFKTGEQTGMHIHEFDYIAIPIIDGDFEVTMGDGSVVEMTQRAGEPYARTKGVHHNVKYVGPTTGQFIEIEHL